MFHVEHRSLKEVISWLSAEDPDAQPVPVVALRGARVAALLAVVLHAAACANPAYLKSDTECNETLQTLSLTLQISNHGYGKTCPGGMYGSAPR